MRPLFKCEFNYVHCKHLNIIYDGFEKLRKKGIIELVIKPKVNNSRKPLLKVLVNNKYRVIYDTLDGFNWVNGSYQENLNYFKNNIKADFYFKRSYSEIIKKDAPQNCQIFPLGLYFFVKPEGKYPIEFKDRLHNIYFNKLRKLYYNFDLSILFNSKKDDLEYYPILNKVNRILFLTRIWNPDDVETEVLKIERERINKDRISVIRECRKEFGDIFIGGLQYDSFSVKKCKDLVVPYTVTNKKSFLRNIKISNICIATTGLHNSIGGKLAEYISASRGIVSQPLNYKPTGDFETGKNYSVFNNESELLNCIYHLLTNRDKLASMMHSNFNYYNNYLRSDILVLNTLFKVIEL